MVSRGSTWREGGDHYTNPTKGRVGNVAEQLLELAHRELLRERIADHRLALTAACLRSQRGLRSGDQRRQLLIQAPQLLIGIEEGFHLGKLCFELRPELMTHAVGPIVEAYSA